MSINEEQQQQDIETAALPASKKKKKAAGPAAEGHNSGEVRSVVEIFAAIRTKEEQRKALSKGINADRAELKKLGHTAAATNFHLMLERLPDDVRQNYLEDIRILAEARGVEEQFNLFGKSSSEIKENRKKNAPDPVETARKRSNSRKHH